MRHPGSRMTPSARRGPRWATLTGLLGLLILLVAGCGADATATPAPPTATAVPPTAVATAAPATATRVPATAAPTAVVVPPGSFVNPVFNQDFPDPFVLSVNGTYYAYATNGVGRNIQTTQSNDLVHWQRGPDALPA